MSFSLGMPALIDMPDLTDLVDLCQELELSFIELNMNLPENSPEKLDPLEVRDISKRYDIEFTLHSHDELDLGSLHPTVRRGHLDAIKEVLDWSAQADIKVLNMHLGTGVYFTLPNRKVWIYEQYEEQFIENLCSTHRDILPLAQAYGVEICTENVVNFHIPFVTRAINTLCRLEGFNLTWDIGHDARSDFKEREVLMRHESRIKHMHLHDYNGISDHQVPGTGTLDIPAMLDFAQLKNIRVLVETKTPSSLRKSVKAVKSMI
ncbi:MAG: sugar phosphate isomerase/epimerase [Euryarchaeota archaeon]|nr:sugar phosphate isomerase/epimerase [Euryarchaeota archaeon]